MVEPWKNSTLTSSCMTTFLPGGTINTMASVLPSNRAGLMLLRELNLKVSSPAPGPRHHSDESSNHGNTSTDRLSRSPTRLGDHKPDVGVSGPHCERNAVDADRQETQHVGDLGADLSQRYVCRWVRGSCTSAQTRAVQHMIASKVTPSARRTHT